ncbi:MAG TPA: Kiwa anti-phage protein KwaB-like domain-containing protein [Nitrospiraceae bacterium]|nr:Kiwa anti-phage protein KwaB-like domain-containing protein [Nitrospiraceae bacterium]
MSAQQALASLRQFLPRARQVTVVVGADVLGDGEAVDTFQRLNTHANVAAEFKRVADEFLAELDEPVLRRYDPGYKPDAHELLYLSLEGRADLQGIVESVSDLDNLEIFAEDEEVVRHLRLYAILVGSGSRKALFFRVASSKLELSQRGLFALLFRHGTFNKVDEKVFLFDEEIDCFAWEDYMFIRSVNRFHRMFRYFEQLRAKADATLDTVLARVPVANAAEFRAAATGQLQMLGKLQSIASKPYLARVTMDDIQRAIKEYDLDIEVQGAGASRALVFAPEPAKRWLILKLLDDDYLDSVMTNAKYEVNSKVALG